LLALLEEENTLTTMVDTHAQREREEGEGGDIIHKASTKHKNEHKNNPDGLNTRFIQINNQPFSLIMVAFL